MNYVLKNEQLFIELCRGPDNNRESSVAVLFCNYLGSEKSISALKRIDQNIGSIR